MAPRADLNGIARAEASPAEAREALLATFGRPSPELLRDAYLALRSWAWKALDQRRRDPELRDWHGIVEACSALMARHGQPALAEHLAAVGELLAESISVAEALPVADVARRRHVARALQFLGRQEGGEAGRGVLGEHLALGQANLTRAINLMLAAGLIERTTHGEEVVLRLSRTGLEALPDRAAANPVEGEEAAGGATAGAERETTARRALTGASTPQAGRARERAPVRRQRQQD